MKSSVLQQTTAVAIVFCCTTAVVKASHRPESLPYDLCIMRTSLIFKYFSFKRVLVCTICSVYTSTDIDFNSTLQKQVRPHFAHVILITDKESILSYIAWAIRPTLRTLYTIPPPMLLSEDGGGVRHYPLVIQTNPSGSGDSAVSTSEVALAATSTRRFPQHSIMVVCQIPHNNKLPREPMLFPFRGCPSWSPCKPQAVPCSTSRCLEGNDEMYWNSIQA